ncbi:hypothetical protein AAULR_02634 [Lacticaseibacillus rhamnosus MTCC 5462]|nr:hypothetical protein AAULR_02634 [Lacticaseibacillus rhamnosus MTCC 5462]
MLWLLKNAHNGMPHRLRGHPFFENNALKTEAHMNHLTNLQSDRRATFGRVAAA